MRTRVRTKWWLCLAVAALAPAPVRAGSARALVSQGNQAYQRRHYRQALEAYEAAARLKPNSPRIWFNKGDALYRKGDFEKAMEAYEQAAVLSRDRKFEARSKFNQGNAAFRQGVRQARINPGAAVQDLTESVRSYLDALRADPTLSPARHNVEVARRVLQLLRRRMKNQPRPGRRNQNSKGQKQPRNQPSRQAGNQPKRPGRPAGAGSPGRQQPPRRPPGAANQPKNKFQPAETPRDILNQERQNRRRRRLHAAGGTRPVDKDW